MSIDLKQFRKNLIYEIKAPLATVIADLQEITALDQLAEMQQKKYGRQALYYFLAIVVSIVLIVIIFNVEFDQGILGLAMIFVFLAIIGLTIAFVYALIKRAKFARLNISNCRYELTKKVLLMLGRDIDKTSEIELKLSFIAIKDKKNKTETKAHPHKAKWQIDKHEHEWLKLKGQFLDKTRFELTATALSKIQYGWKRSRTGKNKYKTKTKSLGLDVVLTLIYPQRRYGAVKILQNDISHAVKLPKLAYMRGLRMTDKAMYMTVRIAPQVEDNLEEVYQTITMIFLSLYQVLNLAKVLSK